MEAGKIDGPLLLFGLLYREVSRSIEAEPDDPTTNVPSHLINSPFGIKQLTEMEKLVNDVQIDDLWSQFVVSSGLSWYSAYFSSFLQLCSDIVIYQIYNLSFSSTSDLINWKYWWFLCPQFIWVSSHPRYMHLFYFVSCHFSKGESPFFVWACCHFSKGIYFFISVGRHFIKGICIFFICVGRHLSKRKYLFF